MTEKEKLILKKLSLTSEWQILEKLAQELINNINGRYKLKDSEWDTLKAVIGDESEIKGIRSLIQAVHQIANELK